MVSSLSIQTEVFRNPSSNSSPRCIHKELRKPWINRRNTKCPTPSRRKQAAKIRSFLCSRLWSSEWRRLPDQPTKNEREKQFSSLDKIYGNENCCMTGLFSLGKGSVFLPPCTEVLEPSWSNFVAGKTFKLRIRLLRGWFRVRVGRKVIGALLRNMPLVSCFPWCPKFGIRFRCEFF